VRELGVLLLGYGLQLLKQLGVAEELRVGKQCHVMSAARHVVCHLVGKNGASFYLLELLADIQAVLEGKVDLVLLDLSNSFENFERVVLTEKSEVHVL